MQFWNLDRHDAVTVATFTRPPRNMMSFAAIGELEALVGQVAADREASVLVLTGGLPGYFVAHADLDDLAALGRGQPVEGDPGSWGRTLALLESIPQPVVAAVNGQAWGGGCEISLACTLRVMAESAHVGQPEVSVGIIPGAGGTQRLPRLVGPGLAAELILSGRVMRSEEAHARGYAQVVLPDDDFLVHVLEWVSSMAAKPRRALVAAKRAVVEGTRLSLEEGLRLEGHLLLECLSPEATGMMDGVSTRYSEADAGEQVEP